MKNFHAGICACFWPAPLPAPQDVPLSPLCCFPQTSHQAQRRAPLVHVQIFIRICSCNIYLYRPEDKLDLYLTLQMHLHHTHLLVLRADM